jgi:sulfate transport system substrate-binding protein
MLRIIIVLAAALAALGFAQCRGAEAVILNASFDIARELFQQYNPAFVEHWKQKTGDSVTVNQSHGGSSKQARAVIDGLEADVVTMNQVTDVDAIAEKSGNVAKDWRKRLPNNASPFSSAIVFLVRNGNPKGIKDWDDLVKPGVSVIVPNPKTSGNGRYSYLSAYIFALRKQGHDAKAAQEFVRQLFKNVPVLDAGGRGATTTFVERQIGDVLLTFEAEVLLTIKELGDKLSKALGLGPIRYNAVEPDAYRSFGFPGADEMGNMFQAYRDFEKEMLAARSADTARKLNPALQTFEQFVKNKKDAILTAIG